MSLGKTGYEAYAQSTGGKTFDGRDMPLWDDLPSRVKDAWNAATVAVAREVYASMAAAEPLPETEPAPKGYPFGHPTIPTPAETKRVLP